MTGFGGKDTASINAFGRLKKRMFISEHLDHKDVKVYDFLIENYFENGAALFGRESPEELQDFRNVCGGKLDGLDDQEVYGIIQFFVQRLKIYAHLLFLSAAKIESARIVAMAKPRTGVCSFYDGMVIDVELCLKYLEDLYSLETEEQGYMLMNQETGIPPLYKLCRCTLEGVIPGL